MLKCKNPSGIHRRGVLFTIVTLQRKIFGFILVKIQCLGFQRDPLRGVVGELAAFFAGDDALLNAEDLILIQHCSVDTVNAGFFYLFLKQHTDPSFFLIIHQMVGKFYCYFWFFAELRR